MTRMHNPFRLGEILRGWMGEMEVTETARKLRVTRVTLSRTLNGASRILADMALWLEAALDTSAEMWMRLQAAFELWQAS